MTIDGKDINFSYGLYFIGKAREKTGKDISEVFTGIQANPHSELVDLMYLSIEVDASLDGKKPPLTKREFVEYIQSSNDLNNDDGFGATFLKELTKSLFENVPKSDEDGKEVKKK